MPSPRVHQSVPGMPSPRVSLKCPLPSMPNPECARNAQFQSNPRVPSPRVSWSAQPRVFLECPTPWSAQFQSLVLYQKMVGMFEGILYLRSLSYLRLTCCLHQSCGEVVFFQANAGTVRGPAGPGHRRGWRPPFRGKRACSGGSLNPWALSCRRIGAQKETIIEGAYCLGPKV